MRRICLFCFLFLLLFSCKREKGKLIFVDADPGNGYHFPYYLFLPENMTDENKLTLIVEPNNSGFISDDLKEHLEKAERTATRDFYLGNFVARNLGFPLLVPIFPRPEKEWKIYTHALDRDAMLQKDNELERIDLQLLAMVKNAKNELAKQNYSLNDKVILTGFSASGTFVNRFVFLHPDEVFAAAAGGLNGLLVLPETEIDSVKINYPVGANDFEELTGETFDIKGCSSHITRLI